MKSIKKDLKKFYDNQATKFHNTRKKVWPEFKILLEEIDNIDKNKLNILEIGCGSWRFCKYLRENSQKQITYTWIDISTWLLDIAQKENPDDNFVETDMVSFVENEKQQKYDLIVCIASFQHIFGRKERNVCVRNFYKILNYDWNIIMLNWSFSKRFIKKFRKTIFISFLKSIFSNREFNDLMIKWKWDNKTFYRYYHIFTLTEISKLLKFNGFLLNKKWFVNKEWELVNKFYRSRNSFISAKKWVIKS